MTPVLPPALQPSALKLHPAKGFWHLHCSRHKTNYLTTLKKGEKEIPPSEGVETVLLSGACLLSLSLSLLT